jgi:hypothetical protein
LLEVRLLLCEEVLLHLVFFGGVLGVGSLLCGLRVALLDLGRVVLVPVDPGFAPADPSSEVTARLFGKLSLLKLKGLD